MAEVEELEGRRPAMLAAVEAGGYTSVAQIARRAPDAVARREALLKREEQRAELTLTLTLTLTSP